MRHYTYSIIPAYMILFFKVKVGKYSGYGTTIKKALDDALRKEALHFEDGSL